MYPGDPLVTHGRPDEFIQVLADEVSTSGRELVESIMIIVHCQGNLLLMVGALHAPGRFTGGLHGGDEQLD